MYTSEADDRFARAHAYLCQKWDLYRSMCGRVCQEPDKTIESYVRAVQFGFKNFKVEWYIIALCVSEKPEEMPSDEKEVECLPSHSMV